MYIVSGWTNPPHNMEISSVSNIYTVKASMCSKICFLGRLDTWQSHHNWLKPCHVYKTEFLSLSKATVQCVSKHLAMWTDWKLVLKWLRCRRNHFALTHGRNAVPTFIYTMLLVKLFIKQSLFKHQLKVNTVSKTKVAFLITQGGEQKTSPQCSVTNVLQCPAPYYLTNIKASWMRIKYLLPKI